MSEHESPHEEFAKTLTRFAQACSRGDAGKALAARSELVLRDKALRAELSAARFGLRRIIEETPHIVATDAAVFATTIARATLDRMNGDAQ